MASGDDMKPGKASPVEQTMASNGGVDQPGESRTDESLPDPLIGKTIAERYQVLSVLGKGGMGTVYLCEHIQLKKRMALKILADEFRRQPALVARFLKEARAAAQIGHANIVDVYDLGELPNGGAFIAMALLEGDDLQAEIKKAGAMPFDRTRRIVGQICRALAAAHAKGIVHRDLKPANIFVVHDADGGEQVKILDFGIAQMKDADGEAARLTQTGAIVGTPAFMSPEQGRGLDTDHRTDIYSVGCILYNLVTGELVFDGNNLMGVISRHLFDEPEPPSKRRPDLGISQELDALILRALAKDPAQRFQTMKELWTGLEALNEDPMAWPEMTSGRFNSVANSLTPAPASRMSAAQNVPPAEAAPKKGSVGVLMGSIAVGAVLAGGIWYMRSDKAAPKSAPVTAPLPAAPVASDIHLEISSAAANAQATIRGKSYPLPLKSAFSKNKEAEMVEISAPDHVSQRKWITFDRDQSIEVALEKVAPVPSPAAPPSGKPIAAKSSAHPVKPGTKTTAPAAPVATATAAKPVAAPTPPPAPTPAPAPAPVAATPPPAPKPIAAPATAPKPVAAAPKPAAPALKPVAQPPLQLASVTISRQVQAHRSTIDACIAEDPSASGKLGFRLLVSPEGKVTTVQLIEADRRYPIIERCIIRTLQTFTFVAPGRPAEGRTVIELD